VRIPLGWLKEHVEVAVETRRLADDLTAAGLAVDAIEGHGEAAVLELDVTTNRVDAMNVRGVAREVSVIYGTALKALDLGFREAGADATQGLRVTVEAPELCPRFCVRILDVRMGPSPAWLRERLEAVGVRPISNVVDLTNYVMMELGQPSHAFDLAKLTGAALHVRWAREGERLTTLDGVARTLTPRVGLVASPTAGLALAGIMGGASSEVSDSTRAVALEAAYWDPLSIRRAGRALGLHTEASHRFERGADPECPPIATARLAHLLERLGAGSTRPGLIDVRPSPQPARGAILRPARLRALLGVDVPEERSQAILEGLGFRVGAAEAGGRPVTIPSWRGDVQREADLVEEVGRHLGLDRIPSTIPPARRAGVLRPGLLRGRRVRDILTGAGLVEVVRLSFVGDGLEGRPGVAVANPLADVEGRLRGSLVDPGLIDTLKRNLSHGSRDVRIFELGRVFLPREGALDERTHLGILLAGAARPRHWSESNRGADFFDAAGLVELLGARLGLGFELGPGAVPSFVHPGQSATVSLDGEALGYLGALHPEAAARAGLREQALLVELCLDAVLARPAERERARPLPRHPGASRDLSLLVGRGVSARELVAWARGAAGPLLRSIHVSDRYQGPPVPEGKVSVTISLRYQDPERTLTSEEVQASLEGVARALRERGAEIRGE
jgi:phenylalanyl-tRNA synthetase beta chain